MTNYVKIDCSSFSNLVEEQKEDNPWSETNLYSNIAVAIFLGLNPNKINNRWPPKGICVKSASSDTLYPEIKERVGGKQFQYYILSVVDTKAKTVYLEGWVDYSRLAVEKNVYKDSYLLSYKDLLSMSEFPK